MELGLQDIENTNALLESIEALDKLIDGAKPSDSGHYALELQSSKGKTLVRTRVAGDTLEEIGKNIIQGVYTHLGAKLVQLREHTRYIENQLDRHHPTSSRRLPISGDVPSNLTCKLKD